MSRSPNWRKGEALARALAYRPERRLKPPKPKGHPRKCLCYDCLYPSWRDQRPEPEDG